MKKIINKKNQIVFEEGIQEFLNPDYIYYQFNNSDKLLVKINDNIFKEQPIIEHDGKTIYSSVSGRLIGTTKSLHVDNKEEVCLVIENNFKEKVKNKKGAIKYINEYSKKDLLSLINKYGIFSYPININAKTIIINGIDKDTYEKTYSTIINNNCTKLLETIDAIASILEIDNTIFIVNNHDNYNVINLTNHIGTYPNIKLKLLNNTYPNGYKELIITNTLSKKQQNEGFIYFTVEDIYNIYTVLKRDKPVTEKLITLSGDSIEKSKVINVKLGTNIAEIIKTCTEIINDNYFVVVNGLISGKTLIDANQPLTSDIRSIFLNTKEEATAQNCINCGLCNSKCPVNLNPKYLLEHKNADRSKCIKCGLCTYICPAKINFNQYLGGNDE